MADFREGQTATNPKTGQKIVFKGGQWMSASAPVASGGGMFGGGRQPTAAQAAALSQRQQNLAALAGKYADVSSRYGKDLKGVGPGSLLEYLPLPKNKAFDSSAAGLSDLALAAFRVPGVGAQSDTELRSFVKANEPHASDPDEQIEAKLANIHNRIKAAGVPIPGETDPASGWKITRIK